MNFVSAEMVKTRKEHRCWGCTTKFPSGSNLRRITNTDCGEIYSHYWCSKCTEWMNKNWKDCNDGIAYGELQEEVIHDRHETKEGK